MLYTYVMYVMSCILSILSVHVRKLYTSVWCTCPYVMYPLCPCTLCCTSTVIVFLQGHISLSGKVLWSWTENKPTAWNVLQSTNCAVVMVMADAILADLSVYKVIKTTFFLWCWLHLYWRSQCLFLKHVTQCGTSTAVGMVTGRIMQLVCLVAGAGGGRI